VSRVPLSVCILTRDEEANLPDCLASVSGLADEILVVDSGSTDRTLEIAREAGARTIETDWPGFPVQRKRAIDAAAHDWVLVLDADERPSPELRDEIATVLASEPAHAGYSFPGSRATWVAGSATAAGIRTASSASSIGAAHAWSGSIRTTASRSTGRRGG
jgi:glycosyltransferase involved in cell wall biosynthesis